MPSPEANPNIQTLSSGVQDPFIAEIEPSVVRYLGPPLTYSEIMAGIMFGTDVDEAERRSGWKVPRYIPHENFSQVTEAVYHDQTNSLTVGILPVENSQTSPVQTVTDALLTGEYYVLGEGSLLIRLQLAGTGESLTTVRTVYSQSKPFGQARIFLAESGYRQEEVDSTSLAARLVSQAGPESAALCSLRAAKNYNLNILQPDVHDDPKNQTRFLVVQSRNGRHEPDLGVLAKGGKLDSAPMAKVAGIVSPKKPAAEDGYLNSMHFLREMRVHASQLGRRNTQREPVGGDSDFFVEFTGHPRALFEAFNNESRYSRYMAFRLLGVYAVGSLYEE